MADAPYLEPTPLELAAHAMCAAVLAYTYPSDVEARSGAIAACAAVGFDYIAVLEGVITQMIPDTVPIEDAMTTARWRVVDHIATVMNKMRDAGARPRTHVSHDGQPTDDLGRTAASYGYENGESWDA